MTEQAFELTSLTMRYWFAGLMLLAVLCALRLHVVNRRQLRRERRSAPNMEYIGELLVVKGAGSIRHGERYAIPRDIVIGRRRRCDVCLRDHSVYPRHARGELRSGGMFIGSIGGAPVALRGQPLQSEIMVRDGALFMIGGITLQLTLYDVVVEYEVDREGRAIDAVQAGGDDYDDERLPFEHEFDDEYESAPYDDPDELDDYYEVMEQSAPRQDYDDAPARRHDDDELPAALRRSAAPRPERSTREFAPLTAEDDSRRPDKHDDYAAPTPRRRRWS